MTLSAAFTNGRSSVLSSARDTKLPKVWFESVHMFFSQIRWDCFYTGNTTAVLYGVLARETALRKGEIYSVGKRDVSCPVTGQMIRGRYVFSLAGECSITFL